MWCSFAVAELVPPKASRRETTNGRTLRRLDSEGDLGAWIMRSTLKKPSALTHRTARAVPDC